VQTLEPVQAEPAAAPAERGLLAHRLPARHGGDIADQGLYHWAIVCGIDAPSRAGSSLLGAVPVATVFFA